MRPKPLMPTAQRHRRGLLGVERREAAHQIDRAVRVAPAVVEPGEGLRHPLADHHRGLGVEGAGVGAVQDVARHDRLVLVAQDAAPGIARRGRAHHLVDRLRRHRAAVPADQVDHRAVGHRHVDRETASPARAARAAAPSSISAALVSCGMMFSAAARPRAHVLGRHVGEALLVGVGVHAGQEGALDAERLVQDLGSTGAAAWAVQEELETMRCSAPQQVVVDPDDHGEVRRVDRRRAAAARAGRPPRGGARARRGVRWRDVASTTDVDAEVAPAHVARVLGGEHADRPAGDAMCPSSSATGAGKAAEDGVELAAGTRAPREAATSLIAAISHVVAAVQDAEQVAADPAQSHDPDPHGRLVSQRPGVQPPAAT